VVHLNKAAHDDHHHFLTGQGVLEPVTDHEAEGEALTELVRSLGRARSPNPSELAKHPVLRRV
jgi:hypothetical protein